jgi:hypothetical protein
VKGIRISKSRRIETQTLCDEHPSYVFLFFWGGVKDFIRRLEIKRLED